MARGFLTEVVGVERAKARCHILAPGTAGGDGLASGTLPRRRQQQPAPRCLRPPSRPRWTAAAPTPGRAVGSADLVHVFVTTSAVLERRIGDLRKAAAPDGAIWVSWPKKASKVATDVTEDVIRRIALANGLVDVKVCAIDDVWSGLKFVRRLRDR